MEKVMSKLSEMNADQLEQVLNQTGALVEGKLKTLKTELKDLTKGEIINSLVRALQEGVVENENTLKLRNEKETKMANKLLTIKTEQMNMLTLAMLITGKQTKEGKNE